ncbi:MAG: acetyl-CoA carboxylase biotin carboxyl carrier protein [Bacteroidetes bacterium]|jgi:acetyl-CoA carboxylase biotin carboxyl carrier protein|nr:acetyl-CoA carboxylase biotin carboxyl carrier protein [Bacteroidota bacterium]
MDLKEIQSLVKLVSSSKVDHLEIERNDFSIKIKKNSGKTEVLSVAQAPVMSAPAAAAPAAPAAIADTAASAEKPAADEVSGTEIKSPMIGTFYRSPTPDKPYFVEVGDEVRVGQTICIVEAMKLFNEIESEVAGRVVKVCVDDASPVEYDQPLFIVEPI